MIKVNRTPCPGELTEDKRIEYTEEFKRTKKDVWNKPFIKAALFKMTDGKCIFCECKLGEESKYMEVEHFHPKSIYPDEVVLWKNLLPICKRCNVAKQDHDTKKYPIIDPTNDDPKKHLYISNYRYKGISPLGHDTIELLSLNEVDKLIKPRVEIGNELIEITERLNTDLVELGDLKSTTNRIKVNNRIKRVKNLLESCLSDKTYSATCATVLFGDKNYHNIVSILKKNDLWDAELVNLEKKAKENCLLDSEPLLHI